MWIEPAKKASLNMKHLDVCQSVKTRKWNVTTNIHKQCLTWNGRPLATLGVLSTNKMAMSNNQEGDCNHQTLKHWDLRSQRLGHQPSPINQEDWGRTKPAAMSRSLGGFACRLSDFPPDFRGEFGFNWYHPTLWLLIHKMGMDQYLLIPFLGGWTSIYQLFW
jgi:hypothetical protein